MASGQNVQHSNTPATHLRLEGAVIVTTDGGPVLSQAARMLQEEIKKRSGLALPVLDCAGPTTPAIVLGTVAAMPSGFEKPDKVNLLDTAEAYSIHVDTASRPAATVFLLGRDARGALFAAGRLIREATMTPGVLAVAKALAVTTAPRFPIRGHQIAYRNTANSYDAWDLETYEQYIRDCILFGTNGIELIPSLRGSRVSGRVMKLPQRVMNLQLAELLHSYGLDVWLFLALGGRIERAETWQAELDTRDTLFGAYPVVDHVLVPGGDPGHTAPELLMPWLRELASVLRKHFPNAGLWVSNQGFTDEQNAVFFQYLQQQQPDWLTGVVFGPWTRLSLSAERERTPAKYPIRRYPDLTHNVRCQYPVPEWDRAFAQTLGREFTNPRPAATAHIHNLLAVSANGFVSYSDGCHDDLNKMIWSALAWDPTADVRDIVRDYARVFFGEVYAEDIARGLWMLESNWHGSALENAGIDRTLAHWLAIETRAGSDLAGNWRFQLYLLRAICDAYVRARLIAETAQEERIYAILDGASAVDATAALDAAQRLLEDDSAVRVRHDLRVRIEQLAEDLHESIGMQYSILAPYWASNTERGAILDTIDLPLNNRRWLGKHLAEIDRMDKNADRLARIQTIVHWEKPRPGAIYDDLGCAWKQPHLVRQATANVDPGFLLGPQEEHVLGIAKQARTPSDLRLSWLDQAQTLFGTPLKMHYEDLDPVASYRIRITYAGRYKAKMSLLADGRYPVHDSLPAPDPVWPVEFPLPREATADGVLDLEWQLDEGRGCQVAEVWLLPEK